MDSRNLLSEEEFLKIKEYLTKISNDFFNKIEKLDPELEEKYDDYDELEKYYMENYFYPFLENDYYPIINRLKKFDLSGIPAPLWTNFPILSQGSYCFDLSNTKANLDFSILDLSYCELYNFKGCNILNLNKSNRIHIDSFDDETIDNNFEVFLDSSYPDDFRKKYMDNAILVDDFISLDRELRERLPDNFHHFYNSYTISSFKSIKIINKLLDAYKEDMEFLLHAFNYDFNIYKFVLQLDQIPFEKFREELYSYLRDYIMSNRRKFVISTLPKGFINENRDILLLDENLPDDVLERYYTSNLTVNDLINYEILRKMAKTNQNIMSYFIDNNFIVLLDSPSFDDLINNHLYFLKMLFTENQYSSSLNQIFSVLKNDSDNFLEFLKKYQSNSPMMLHYYLLYIHDTKNDDSNYSLEELINKSELRSEEENRLLKELINDFGIENIMRFQEESHFFSNKKNENPLYNLEYVLSTVKNEKYYSPSIKDNYEEFRDCILKVFALKRDYDTYLFDYRDVDEEFKKNNPSLFLREDELEGLSEEVKKYLIDAFYQRNMKFEDVKKYPILIKVLNGKNLLLPFESTNVNHYGINTPFFLELCGIYGHYFRSCYYDFNIKCDDLSFEESCDLVNSLIFAKIKNGSIKKYDESLPDSFKNKYPFLFLPSDVLEDLKNKFYNRLLTIEDFEKDKGLLEYFTNNNIDIAAGLNVKYSKLIHIKDENLLDENEKKLKIARDYENIPEEEDELQDEYISAIVERYDEVDDKLLKTFREVLFRLLYSNSSKLSRLRVELVVPITRSDDPMKSLKEIEDIYLKNHLPDVSKTYQVFRILHTDKDGKLNLNTSYNSSPVLLGHSARSNELIISSDIMKVAMESNNPSIRGYIDSIKNGYKLYLDYLKDGFSSYEEDKRNEKMEQLKNFSKMLLAIYNGSLLGKNSKLESSSNVISDIEKVILLLSPNGSIDYDLTDRVTKMFVYFAGFNNYNELLEHMDMRREYAELRNRERVNHPFILHKGDLIKGINNPKYLMPTLTNGAVASEFLGGGASSIGDCTPLDTDFSYVNDNEISLDQGISHSISRGYGPVWIIIENGDPDICLTRNSNGSTLTNQFQKGKVELFETNGSGHFGIRTGIGSTHISYIVTDDYNPKMGVEVALNGFYIPIVSRRGKVLFSPEDYDKIREKMNGLSHYGLDKFNFSPNLMTKEIEGITKEIESNHQKTKVIGDIIKREIYNALQNIEVGNENLSFSIKDCIDGDLSPGIIEVIDTGSTGRGTNSIDDADFDFMLRIDASLFKDSMKKRAIIEKIAKLLDAGTNLNGDIRAKNVKINGLDKPVDIDISFEPKKDNISYSTDMCLKDRLNTIYEQDREKYKEVCANILYAKEVLKKGGCYYKHGHSKCTGYGGLGGVGIENWILQHGGSFIDAAESFLNACMNDDKTGYVDWNTFKNRYSVWDFGENFHGSENQHDNFVYSNMDEDGYKKMIEVLKLELEKIRKNDDLVEMLTDDEDVSRNDIAIKNSDFVI